METKTIKEQLRQFTYYIIIAAISLLTIIVFPLIGSGSSISIEQCFPTTQVGWIIYIIESLKSHLSRQGTIKIKRKSKDKSKRKNQKTNPCKRLRCICDNP